MRSQKKSYLLQRAIVFRSVVFHNVILIKFHTVVATEESQFFIISVYDYRNSHLYLTYTVLHTYISLCLTAYHSFQTTLSSQLSRAIYGRR